MTDKHNETSEWLESFAEYDDHGKAAAAALDDLHIRGRARHLLFPIMQEAFLMHRRTGTRRVERATPVREVFSGETSLERRTDRLARWFPVGDGRRVFWGEATVNDHRDRIRFLRDHIAGVERTISEHEEAILLIESHGVSCLNEIEGAA